MLVSLYEDYKDGIVDKSDFAIIKESFEVKRSEAEKAIDRLQKEAENIAAGIERDTEWLEEHRKWKTMPSLTRNVVVSLIQSVKVYEGGDIEIVLDVTMNTGKSLQEPGSWKNSRIRKGWWSKWQGSQEHSRNNHRIH